MAYTQLITDFAQSVYLTVKGRYLDDITDTDGQDYVARVVNWTNLYLGELETTTDPAGRLVYWNWSRVPNYDFGDAVLGDSTLGLASTVLNVVADVERPLYIEKAGVVVSEWEIVDAGQIISDSSRNLVAKAGRTLYFNRSFTAGEAGGEIKGDITTKLIRLTDTEDTVLDLVEPQQLLVLGVAKNSSLPDIVQGGLSPSYVQKYNDLLQSTIAANGATSSSDYTDRDSLTYIGML